MLALGAVVPAGLAADPTPATADSARPRAQAMREERLKQLDEKLHLTAEQKAKIEAIWKTAGDDARDARKEERAATRERRKQMRETMKKTHDEVRAVLTPEQQKIFDAMPRPARPAKSAEPAP